MTTQVGSEMPAPYQGLTAVVAKSHHRNILLASHTTWLTAQLSESHHPYGKAKELGHQHGIIAPVEMYALACTRMLNPTKRWMIGILLAVLAIAVCCFVWMYSEILMGSPDQETINLAYQIAGLVMPREADVLPLEIKKEKDFIEVMVPHRGKMAGATMFSIWKWGENQHLVIEKPSGLAWPSAYRVNVKLVDASRHLLLDKELSLGWRVMGGTPSIQQYDGFPILMYHDGLDRKQYYTIVKNDIVLIRFEDPDGKLCRQRYEFPNHVVGSQLPSLTADQWEASLNSTNKREQLQALVWLGGEHSSVTYARPNMLVEPVPEVELFKQVRNRASVQQQIEKLANSPDPWLREMAKLAKTPKYGTGY